MAQFRAQGFPKSKECRAFVSVRPGFRCDNDSGDMEKDAHAEVCFYMSPEHARELAADLAVAADKAEGATEAEATQ